MTPSLTALAVVFLAIPATALGAQESDDEWLITAAKAIGVTTDHARGTVKSASWE